MSREQLIQELATDIQKDFHLSVREIMRQLPSADFETAFNTVLYRKLAELTAEIRSITDTRYL